MHPSSYTHTHKTNNRKIQFHSSFPEASSSLETSQTKQKLGLGRVTPRYCQLGVGTLRSGPRRCAKL